MSTDIRLEICVDTVAGFMAAVNGGADRIELCAALSTGGLTPSPGLIDLARLSPTPSRVMIRPRAGDFVYSRDDIDIMRRDIDAVRNAGLAGIVIGVNKVSGELNEAALMQLRHHAQGLEIALHRAIDLTPDPVAAVDIAVGLKFDTILTSGGANSAFEGLETLATMAARADGRIEIMAGSGINADNVVHILRASDVRAVHASGSVTTPALNPKAVSMGFSPSHIKDTDQATVARLGQIVKDFATVTA